MFIIGSLLLLSWNVVLLAITMFIQTPHSSLYPECDFASKVVQLPHSSRDPSVDEFADQLIYPLSNAESANVEQRLQSRRFFIRVLGAPAQDDYIPRDQHVGITLEDTGDRIRAGGRYT